MASGAVTPSEEMTHRTNIGGHSTDYNNGGFPGNINSTLNVSVSSVLDYNHPLFLSPADVSGVNLISFQLLGIENYAVWSRSMKLALLGRNKMGLVDGTCAKNCVDAELKNQWERVNAIVLSWILNSLSKSLLGGVAFASSAQNVWNDLKERFDRVDGSRTFSLHKEIVTLQQGTDSMSVYFTKLKNLWDEFEAVVPSPECSCDKSRSYVDHLNRQKLYQFLMGLNDSYIQARSQILLMSPVPNVNQAYAMLVNDECQRSATSSSLGLNSVGVNGIDPLVMYSRSAGTYGVQSTNKFKKGCGLICDFCRCKGHTKDQCYKLIGYPSNFKSKKKGSVNNVSSAYNVIGDYSSARQGSYNQDSEGSVHGYLNYGFNTNVPVHNKGKQVVDTNYNEENEVAKQLQGCTFTKDQYNQILQMLKHAQGNENAADGIAQVNAAGSLHWKGEGDW